METSICEPTLKTAVENLRTVINSDDTLIPVEEDDATDFSKDTPFSLFGQYFSGVKMFCHGVKNPNNKGPHFTKKQENFLKKEFLDIDSIIQHLKECYCSTEITRGRRSDDLPLKEVPKELLEVLYRRVKTIPDNLEAL